MWMILSLAGRVSSCPTRLHRLVVHQLAYHRDTQYIVLDTIATGLVTLYFKKLWSTLNVQNLWDIYSFHCVYIQPKCSVDTHWIVRTNETVSFSEILHRRHIYK